VGRYLPALGEGGHAGKRKAQYISLKDLLRENGSKRIKQQDNVKKLLMRLKGFRRRHVPLATGLCLL
jgi:RNase P/RNase MRP subunit p30